MRQHRSLIGALLVGTLAACGADPFGVEEAIPDEVVVPAPPSAAPTASAATVQTSAPNEPDPEGSERFIASVSVAEQRKPGQKGLHFGGVTLSPENRKTEPRPGREEIVASYSQGTVWQALDGKRVSVLGTPYFPPGRAISGQHMEILEARLVDPGEGAAVLGFGRSRELEGTFREVTTPDDQKGAGEKVLYFDVKEGSSFEVYDGFGEDAEQPPRGKPLKVKAHEVELSKFMQRRGGPFLWVRHLVKPDK